VRENDETRAADLEKSLRRRFRVVESTIEIAGDAIEILHPASAEELINEADFERDERLPYWAELWPSARILAERVAQEEAAGRTLLELGCGAGLVSTCASLSGFGVCASDYYEDALRFAFVNAWRNGAGAIETAHIDWRSPPGSTGRFDRVVASDVLYEQPYGPLVARVIAATLARDGVALVADPGRVAVDPFVKALDEVGLSVIGRTTYPFVDGEIRQTITVFEIRRLSS
jgi:predicted nicotinamide N-methyase